MIKNFLIRNNMMKEKHQLYINNTLALIKNQMHFLRIKAETLDKSSPFFKIK